MSSIADQFQEAADKATQASAQADTWATGPVGTYVPTDSGPVPTIAEFTQANQVRSDEAINALGWVLAGDFTAGCTVTGRNQYVLVVGGPGYRWDGALPKVVAPGSSPTPIATGAWVLVGDASLRGDLGQPGGAALIGTSSGRTLQTELNYDSAKTREALRRSYAEAGYTMVAGSFELGGTVATAAEVLLYEGDGKAYSWGGTLPKVVSAGSTPASSGGIGAGAWVDRSNISLRDELAKRGGIGLLCAKMWAGETITVGCYGDSTTDGKNTTGWIANPTSGGSAVGNSDHNLTAPNAWPAKLQAYLREVFKNNNIKTFNAGYDGQRMDNGWAFNNYSAAMVNNPYYGTPNVCFIGFGLNDITAAGSQIDAHVEQTVKLMFRMVSEGTIPVILTCDAEFRNGQFSDTRDHKEARRELDAAKQALGDKYGVLVVDTGDVLKQWIQNNDDGYNWPKEQSDGLHFGDNGHSLKAQYVASRMFIDTVQFSDGIREINTFSSEAAYVGNYASVYKLTNNKQGGNVLYGSGAPANTDMMTVWVWNTCKNAYVVYQGIEGDGITDAVAYTVAPSVIVKELFGGVAITKSLISPGFFLQPTRRKSDEQFIHSRLKYGLNCITYRSGDAAALYYGSFKIVDAGSRLASSNALMMSGVQSKMFPKDTGVKWVLPERPNGLFNIAGGFVGERVSVSFDISCPRNSGVLLLSGQGWDGQQTGVDNNQQNSLLLLRNSADGLVLYAAHTDNLGGATFSQLGFLNSIWTSDARVGRIELYRSANNQMIEVYDSFQGGTLLLVLTLPNTGVSSRWSGYVGGLYASTNGAVTNQVVTINRMVINR